MQTLVHREYEAVFNANDVAVRVKKATSIAEGDRVGDQRKVLGCLPRSARGLPPPREVPPPTYRSRDGRAAVQLALSVALMAVALQRFLLDAEQGRVSITWLSLAAFLRCSFSCLPPHLQETRAGATVVQRHSVCLLAAVGTMACHSVANSTPYTLVAWTVEENGSNGRC